MDHQIFRCVAILFLVELGILVGAPEPAIHVHTLVLAVEPEDEVAPDRWQNAVSQGEELIMWA